LVTEMMCIYDLPGSLPAMAAIATVSAAAARGYKLTGAAGGFDQFANVYFLAGTPPGDARTCVQHIIKPLLAGSDYAADESRAFLVDRLLIDQRKAFKQRNWLTTG